MSKPQNKESELPTMTIIPTRNERVMYGHSVYRLEKGEPITILKELAEPLIREGYATKLVV